MAAVYYLVLCCITGYLLVKACLPSLLGTDGYRSLPGDAAKVPRWIVALPASFLVGTLVVTWTVYLAACLFRETGRPLYYGNITAILLFTLAAIVGVVAGWVRKRDAGKGPGRPVLAGTSLFKGTGRLETVLLLVTVFIAAFMMFYTFHVKGDRLVVGLSVFSDFSAHMAMIRSFSHGMNFPTEYPLFADGTVRYHFMFQFLAGNLEFLGMRLDWAFNVPSILSYVSFILLLYGTAAVITGRKAAGILTCLLFFFRSSFAFFTYLKDLTAVPHSPGELLKRILLQDEFIGKTPNESWGFWNQNVFLNQRHLAFALGGLLLALLALYPLFREMLHALSSAGPGSPGRSLKTIFCRKAAWLPRSYVRPLFLGLLLGLLSFWNGAVVVAALPVLFILALLSERRLEYLVVAVITAVLAYLQARFFIGSGTAITPGFYFGFIAGDKTLPGIFFYLLELLGILPFVIAAALWKPAKGMRWLCLAFFMPFVLAFTLKLTPDIGMNHKYIILSVLLLNVLAADFLLRLYRFSAARPVAVLLAAVLMITGVVDNMTLFNRNNPGNIRGLRPVTLKLDDPLTVWVEKNTDPRAIFLTDTYYIHPLLLSGRKIYLGWQYFAWSAGYDTGRREVLAGRMFNALDREELLRLVRENNISYIVIDDGLRNSTLYHVNEQLIASVFKEVYRQEEAHTVLYSTNEVK